MIIPSDCESYSSDKSQNNRNIYDLLRTPVYKHKVMQWRGEGAAVIPWKCGTSVKARAAFRFIFIHCQDFMHF